MTTYLYRCTQDPAHGEEIVNKSMDDAARAEYCTRCFLERAHAADKPVDVAALGLLPMRRIYTTPITGIASFGRNMWRERTPEWRWRPKNEDQARQFRDKAREEGRRVQFGAGRSTGS